MSFSSQRGRIPGASYPDNFDQFRERTNIPAGEVYGCSPIKDGLDNFDQFLNRTCPMNETDIGDQKTEKHAALGFAYGAGAPSNPANYAREVLVRELKGWRGTAEVYTKQVEARQKDLASALKLQFDAQQRVASLETALRTV